MKLLIVGGNGMVGGHAALRFTAKGHAVTIAARTPPMAGTPLGALPFVRIDYIADVATAPLAGYDAMIFAAGQDVRHVPAGENADQHWQRANAEAAPRFFAAAKAAGIKQAVLIGSFYPQAAPELVATSAYVAGRLAADEGVRALADASFHVTVLNAPFIIGYVPGLVVPSAQAMARWALGQLPLPRTAPPGGVNVISCDTLTDAMEGALIGGGSSYQKNGRAYLIGDENRTFQDYLGLFFRAAGDECPLDVVDEPHKLVPDSAILRGRGSTIYYDANPAEVALLGYRRHDIARTVGLIVNAVKETL